MNTRDLAEKVASADLDACAAAVLLWRRNGRLDAGSALHKVAEVWASDPSFENDSLQQAEGTVVKLALELAASANHGA